MLEHAAFPGLSFDLDIFLVEEKNQLPLLCHPFQTLSWICQALGEYLEVSPHASALSTPYTPPQYSFSVCAQGILVASQKNAKIGYCTEESHSASLQRRVDFLIFCSELRK